MKMGLMREDEGSWYVRTTATGHEQDSISCCVNFFVLWFQLCHLSANSSTKMADDDASFMDKFVKKLESSLVEFTQMKTQVEKVLVNILINKWELDHCR